MTAQVDVESQTTAEKPHPIRALAASMQAKGAAVLATVIEIQGASPAKVGAQMVLLADGSTVGTVGGGKLEAAILEDAQVAFSDGQPCLRHYRLTEEGPEAVGTLCGGEVRVFVQPYFPPPQLIILGGGHIGKPLKVMGEAAGFDVVVVDVAVGRADAPELDEVPITDDSYAVLITTDHISDEAAMRKLARTPVRYIGMIGSRAKCRSIRDHLTEDGYSEQDLEKVYAPIGLELGGTTPQEIAVGILAEVVAVRRRGSGGFRSRAAKNGTVIDADYVDLALTKR